MYVFFSLMNFFSEAREIELSYTIIHRRKRANKLIEEEKEKKTALFETTDSMLFLLHFMNSIVCMIKQKVTLLSIQRIY